MLEPHGCSTTTVLPGKNRGQCLPSRHRVDTKKAEDIIDETLSPNHIVGVLPQLLFLGCGLIKDAVECPQ